MFTLACKDIGIDCPYVAQGATKEDALKDSMGHRVKEHGMDPAELSKSDEWQKAMPMLKEV